MRRFAALLLFMAFASAGLSACHTVAGMGQDIKAGGQAIQKAADTAAH